MGTKPRTRQVRADVPFRLLSEVQSLVDTGWFRSVDEVVIDALRKFIESHPTDLMQDLIHEDMEWGLRGTD